ncbi:envelope glycoprotein 42 [Equid gammaherpesvirus 2]|nr:envelope glycoprotein 42 [Equid gammaherpesvirus 2]
MAKKLNFTSCLIFTSCFTAFIVSLCLLVSSCVNLVNDVIIPSVHMSRRADITPFIDNYTINFTDLHFFTDETNASVPQPEAIFINSNNFSLYAHNCSARDNCSVHNASITQEGRCYHYSRAKYTFAGCLEFCKSYSPCYYLINPQKHMTAVRQNINESDTYWVGIFKSPKNTWVDLDNSSVTGVYDLYEDSYCAYIGLYTEVPWPSFYCDTPRHCLCGGSKGI